jgi:hypothetical protein
LHSFMRKILLPTQQKSAKGKLPKQLALCARDAAYAAESVRAAATAALRWGLRPY